MAFRGLLFSLKCQHCSSSGIVSYYLFDYSSVPIHQQSIHLKPLANSSGWQRRREDMAHDQCFFFIVVATESRGALSRRRCTKIAVNSFTPKPYHSLLIETFNALRQPTPSLATVQSHLLLLLQSVPRVSLSRAIKHDISRDSSQQDGWSSLVYLEKNPPPSGQDRNVHNGRSKLLIHSQDMQALNSSWRCCY